MNWRTLASSWRSSSEGPPTGGESPTPRSIGALRYGAGPPPAGPDRPLVGARAWRSYTTRALEARKRYRQLAADCPPGPVADYLANSVAKVDAATEEHWALAKSGAGLVDPPGRTERAAKALEEVQAEPAGGPRCQPCPLESREGELASQLRSFRHLESVSAQISNHLSELSAQLEGVVASAGELVASAGAAGADLSTLSSELSSLTGALDEARRIMAGPPPS